MGGDDQRALLDDQSGYFHGVPKSDPWLRALAGPLMGYYGNFGQPKEAAAPAAEAAVPAPNMAGLTNQRPAADRIEAVRRRFAGLG